MISLLMYISLDNGFVFDRFLAIGGAENSVLTFSVLMRKTIFIVEYACAFFIIVMLVYYNNMNGFIGLLVNTVLDLSLYKTFGAAGVAWATTGTYVVVSGLLGLSIKKKNKFIQYHLLLPFLFRVLLSCVFMSVIIMVLKEFFIYIGLYDITNISKNITFLVFTVVLGAIFYFVGLLLLKTTEAINIVKVICRRKK